MHEIDNESGTEKTIMPSGQQCFRANIFSKLKRTVRHTLAHTGWLSIFQSEVIPLSSKEVVLRWLNPE